MYIEESKKKGGGDREFLYWSVFTRLPKHLIAIRHLNKFESANNLMYQQSVMFKKLFNVFQ